ncbi:MAG: N-acetylmuramoyl-L-alanine amidase [Syntrophobacteraceae bacterium]
MERSLIDMSKAGVWGSLIVLIVCSLISGCTRTVYSVPPQPALPETTQAPQALPNSTAGVCVAQKPLYNPGIARTITHEVAPLETIWRLSRMYDVSPEAIYSANGMNPGTPLQIGQKLVIPNAKMLRHVIPLYPNSRWQYIIIHHTATDIGNATLVNRSHHDRGFWNGLGYHFIIDNGSLGKGDGQIEVAPRWIKQQCGAHCKVGGMNERGIGIALVGNFNIDLPTRNQLQSLVYLLQVLSQRYHIGPDHIWGHRDIEGANTDCPGKRFPWSEIRRCLALSQTRTP